MFCDRFSKKSKFLHILAHHIHIARGAGGCRARDVDLAAPRSSAGPPGRSEINLNGPLIKTIQDCCVTCSFTIGYRIARRPKFAGPWGTLFFIICCIDCWMEFWWIFNGFSIQFSMIFQWFLHHFSDTFFMFFVRLRFRLSAFFDFLVFGRHAF